MSSSLVTPFHLGADRLPPPVEARALDGTPKSVIRAFICGLAEDITDSPTAMAQFIRGHHVLISDFQTYIQHGLASHLPTFLIRQLVINRPLAQAYTRLLDEERSLSSTYLSSGFSVAYPYLDPILRTRLFDTLSRCDDGHLALILFHDLTVTSRVVHQTNDVLSLLQLQQMSPSFLANYFAKTFRSSCAATSAQLTYLSTLSRAELADLKARVKLHSPAYLVSPHGDLASPYKTIARSADPIECLRRTTRTFPIMTPIDLRASAHPWANSRDLLALWLAFLRLAPGRCLLLEKPTPDDVQLAITDASIKGHDLSSINVIQSLLQEPSLAETLDAL